MQTRLANVPFRENGSQDHPWLEAAVAALDERLRRRQGVFEYCQNPDCLFRIRLACSGCDLVLSDGVRLEPGERVIDLHLWNEQFPPFPPSGPTLQWARGVNRKLEISLRELSYFLSLRRELDDVRAVCGTLAFVSAARATPLARFFGRFGFEQIPLDAAPAAGDLRRLGENMLISMMVLARNAAALRADTLRRGRLLMAISRQKLQQRYGPAHERAIRFAPSASRGG